MYFGALSVIIKQVNKEKIRRMSLERIGYHGLILIFRLSKENKIFYVAGGFFLVLGVWWLLDSLFPDWKVFQGTPGAVLKVLTFVVLVVLAIVFFILNRRGWKAEAAMNKMQEKDDEKDNF